MTTVTNQATAPRTTAGAARGTRRLLGGLPSAFLVLFLAVLVLAPMLWLLLGSFKTQREFLEEPVWALPQQWSIDNYVQALTTGNFATYFLNTAVSVLPALFLMLVLGSAAGFALEVLVWKGRNGVLLLFLAGIMVPVQMILLPLFTIYFQTNLTGTLWPLFLTYTAAGLPLTVFLMATYFRA